MNENYKKFYEMLFIYNAISNGWTVKKINKSKYKFTNNFKNLKISLKDIQLNKFIKDNLQLNPFNFT